MDIETESKIVWQAIMRHCIPEIPDEQLGRYVRGIHEQWCIDHPTEAYKNLKEKV